MSWLIFLALLLPASQDSRFPPIGIIDFYGLSSVSERQIREALQIKEGDPSSGELKEAKRRLELLSGVTEARLHFVCCDAGKAILYVGIREKGASSIQFHPAPQGKVRLPQDVIQAGEDYQNVTRPFSQSFVKRRFHRSLKWLVGKAQTMRARPSLCWGVSPDFRKMK